MLARDRLSLEQMSWMLVKVFFGYGGDYRLLVMDESSANSVRQIGLSWPCGFPPIFRQLALW